MSFKGWVVLNLVTGFSPLLYRFLIGYRNSSPNLNVCFVYSRARLSKHAKISTLISEDIVPIIQLLASYQKLVCLHSNITY